MCVRSISTLIFILQSGKSSLLLSGDGYGWCSGLWGAGKLGMDMDDDVVCWMTGTGTETNINFYWWLVFIVLFTANLFTTDLSYINENDNIYYNLYVQYAARTTTESWGWAIYITAIITYCIISNFPNVVIKYCHCHWHRQCQWSDTTILSLMIAFLC